MGKVQQITVIFVMMNLFLYPFLLVAPSDFGGAKSEVQDTVSGFANIEGESVSFNGTGAQEAAPTRLKRDTVETGSGLTTYVSGLDSVFSFLSFLMGMVGNIYYLLLAMNIPGLVAAMVGVPIAIIQILGIISAIRGYDI